MSQPVLQFFIAKNDGDYVLQPVAQQLRDAGVPLRKARAVLKVAALRALRLAAQDTGLPVRLATKEAGRIASKTASHGRGCLIARMTPWENRAGLRVGSAFLERRVVLCGLQAG